MHFDDITILNTTEDRVINNTKSESRKITINNQYKNYGARDGFNTLATGV